MKQQDTREWLSVRAERCACNEIPGFTRNAPDDVKKWLLRSFIESKTERELLKIRQLGRLSLLDWIEFSGGVPKEDEDEKVAIYSEYLRMRGYVVTATEVGLK